MEEAKIKKPWLAGILQLFLSPFAAGYFYLGKTKRAIGWLIISWATIIVTTLMVPTASGENWWSQIIVIGVMITSIDCFRLAKKNNLQIIRGLEKKEREIKRLKLEEEKREKERLEKELKREKLEEEEKERKKLAAEKTRERYVKRQRQKGLELFGGKWVLAKDIPNLKKIQIGLNDNFQSLSPFDFEEFIAKLFRAMGYQTQVTPKTGDYGIDIIAKKGNDTLAIQCKRYNQDNPVGNRDVQMLLGAMKLKGVKANHSVLITTSHFTVQAKEQAEENAIELWDKHLLHEMVKKYLMKL